MSGKKRRNELSQKTLFGWAVKRPAHPNDSNTVSDLLPADAGVPTNERSPDAESVAVEPSQPMSDYI